MTTAAITTPPRSGRARLTPREDLGQVSVDATRDGAADVAALLDRIALVLGHAEADAETRERREVSRERALAIVETGGREIGVVSFLSDALMPLSCERGWSPADVAGLVDSVAAVAEVSSSFLRTSVCLRVVRDPALLELPPEVAIETALTVLVALGPITDASVWRRGNESGVECLASSGASAPSVEVRALAAEALAGPRERRLDGSSSLRAVPLLHAQQSAAALVVCAPIGDIERASALAEEAAAVLGLVLERDALLERSAARERSLMEASERRLTRLAFDLHDGPVQDVVALAAEVRLLRQELVDGSEQPAGRESVAARFDALEAQLLEVGGELREVSSSLEPTKALRSVGDGLASLIEAFRTQTGIRATLELAGDFESLTVSQRIAALRIVQEALANVREHSGATHARVAASATDGFVRLEVTDDGRGFDPEPALARAAKNGRLGLVGMSERVRLLGGRLDIHSRPGGPTTVSAVLRQWRPAAPTEDARADAC
jgi:signal transduction histidine kinase